jgi:hypothetical protein
LGFALLFCSQRRATGVVCGSVRIVDIDTRQTHTSNQTMGPSDTIDPHTNGQIQVCVVGSRP